ncbi:hypothetical protein [Fusobacterium sp.]|jgi:hypothetical protein|uniref:Uncharacterized protein n=1 Tax=Fusobacterium nucleatum TaxID=851 RepID=A0A323U230_FUSNU|nr:MULTISPECIES: hypothetical protein [Fusobacterium]PCR86138.1 hypothetical protein CQA79_00010 [Fusobacterium nucleatum]PZA05470.1 hypothetical protein DNF10_01095 [Fusobacterium nucleatum]QJX50284.1 hypothetical protein HOO60_05160 [Fusobacterium nucleatum]HCE33447.1 hypothetical protein [Fusobacterium sp.]
MTTLFNKQQKILILNKYIRQETLQLKKYEKLESINSSEINRTVINYIFYYIKWLKAKKKYIINQTKKNSINLKLKNKKKLAANKNYEFLMSKI